MTPSPAAAAPPSVLIHGLWTTPLSRESWARRFEERGHRALAPAWPGMDAAIDRLRHDTSRLERLGVKEVADHALEWAVARAEQLPHGSA